MAPKNSSIKMTLDGHFDVESILENTQYLIDSVYKEGHQTKEALNRALIEKGDQVASNYGWPDIYTFTKWLGEQTLLKNLKRGSLTIIRPSIVESTLNSPKPGLIDGIKCLDVMIYAFAKKKISQFPGDQRCIVDIVPADIIANSIILCTSELFNSLPKVRVYQCCSGSTNPILYKEFIEIINQEALHNRSCYPDLFNSEIKKPFKFTNKIKFLFVLNALFKTVKSMNFLCNKLNISYLSQYPIKYEKAIEFTKTFIHYGFPNYIFHNDALLKLLNNFDSHDQEQFSVDIKKIIWENYLTKVHLAGLNKYISEQRGLMGFVEKK